MSEPVKPGTQAAALIADEERLLAKVQARVAAGPRDLEERTSAADFDKELISLRDQIAEAKPEDLPPLVEQMARLSAIRGRLGGGIDLPVDVTSPYFAHMQLQQEGAPRDVLIGKRGFIDRAAGVQIVDWRNAPISQVYYRYDEGDDYDEDVDGRRFSGSVVLRRNVSIAATRLRRIGCPQGTFVRDARNVWHAASGDALPVLQGGSGSASRAPKAPLVQKGKRGGPSRLGVHHGPSHRPDKHLPEIAALIDREQFELITQPNSGIVVIQGGAGSGKTTVALHRVAYLCFADPKRFHPKEMLVVVPTHSLARYVADVLPSLGVPNVPVLTYGAWAKNMRLRLMKGTTSHENPDTPEVVSRLKKHPLLMHAMEGYVAEQIAATRATLEAMHPELAIAFDRKKRGLIPKLLAARKWARSDERDPALRVAAESTVKRLMRRGGDVLTDWAEILTDKQRLMPLVAAGALSERELDNAISWCSQQLNDRQVWTDDDEKAIEAIDGRALDEDSPAAQFDPEDNPILIRFIQLKRGGLVGPDTDPVKLAHVAIDEAQDRSAIEVKVLLEATEPDEAGRRSVTIAGDTAQRLIFDNAFSGWEPLLEEVGEKNVMVRPLKLSYRSTAEVMALSREVLGPELAPVEDLVARSGAPVEVHEFGDIGEAVAFLGDALRSLVGRERTASCAVIARYPEQADAYFEGLRRSEVPSLRRVKNHDFPFVPGVDVTDVTQVKGLEFDYVVMVDVNASIYPDSVENRHLLHIAMTRAAHQLWIVTTGKPSPLLPSSMTLTAD